MKVTSDKTLKTSNTEISNQPQVYQILEFDSDMEEHKKREWHWPFRAFWFFIEICIPQLSL